MQDFQFIINSPKGKIFRKNVSSVNFKSGIGFLTIYANHSNVTGIVENSSIKTNNEIIGFAAKGVYRFYDNTLEFVIAYFEKEKETLENNLINTKNELKLSNVKNNVAADLLLEIELLKNFRKNK